MGFYRRLKLIRQYPGVKKLNSVRLALKCRSDIFHTIKVMLYWWLEVNTRTDIQEDDLKLKLSDKQKM